MFIPPAPTPPLLDKIDIGDDYVNVSWNPVGDPDDPKQNPGSKFVVEYKEIGGLSSVSRARSKVKVIGQF